MRYSLLLVCLFPAVAHAQTEEIDKAIKQRLAAGKFVQLLQDGKGGFASGPKDLNPSLKATSAAIRALKLLTGKASVPNVKLHAEYVMSCYDPKTGGFADTPGGKPDLYTTAVGVMAAVELDIPKEKFAKSMDYLKANAESFEDVRIGAAAVEAWGVKDCPFDLKPWKDIAAKYHRQEYNRDGTPPDPRDGGARILGSTSAFSIRLGTDFRPAAKEQFTEYLQKGQRDDGAWSKKNEKASDLETSYRVMRALHLLEQKPADIPKLRAFIDKCRNVDGGYGVKPGDASTTAGTYFAATITKWLDEMEN